LAPFLMIDATKAMESRANAACGARAMLVTVSGRRCLKWRDIRKTVSWKLRQVMFSVVVFGIAQPGQRAWSRVSDGRLDVTVSAKFNLVCNTNQL
jgi:hypothetical protein